MYRFFIIGFLLLGRVLIAEEFAFEGTHFLASYMSCDPKAMGDTEALKEGFLDAVSASGATVLDSASYVFSPCGMTFVVLLSESHASIHTYPEHDACFIDLFTCGTSCSFEEFDRVLREYLQPKDVNVRVLLRGQETHDFSRP